MRRKKNPPNMLKAASSETPMGTESGKFNLALAKSFPLRVKFLEWTSQ